MKKIKSVFQRNYDGDHLVRNEVTPGCEWVLNGEGVATRKYDGTCCLIQDGILYKRYDAKNGKTPPSNFVPAQEKPDEITGHWPGWVPVDPENSADKWYINAVPFGRFLQDGTYELCGIHFQGNPEGVIGNNDIFIRHGVVKLQDVPRTFDGIKQYLCDNYIEGIVFWNDDGEMAKIKRTDFGFEWNGRTAKR